MLSGERTCETFGFEYALGPIVEKCSGVQRESYWPFSFFGDSFAKSFSNLLTMHAST